MAAYISVVPMTIHNATTTTNYIVQWDDGDPNWAAKGQGETECDALS